MLYHGTSSRYLGKIKKEGLKPRLNKRSNWSNPSQKNFVYLSSMYPMYYSVYTQKNDKLVIIEIDETKLDENKLYPDDDFIWHNLKRQGKAVDIEYAGSLIMQNQHLWKESLNLLGCVAYLGSISTGAMNRIAIIDNESMNSTGRMFIFGLMDVFVVPIVIAFRKEAAQHAIKWIFGDTDCPFTDLKMQHWRQISSETLDKYINSLNQERKNHIKIETTCKKKE
jgi:hypothetical protein